MEAFFLALAVAIGSLLMLLANPAGELEPRWAALLLELGLGAGFGMAIVSLLFFVLILVHAALPMVMFPAEAALLIASAGLLLLGIKRRSGKRLGSNAPGFWWYRILGGALVVQVLLVAAAMTNTARTSPYGNWDAWAIWNLRAKYLAGPGDTWKRAFSPLLVFSHPDYPPLLSGFVAQVWKFSGRGTANLVPSLTAAAFAASVLVLLVSALTLVRGTGSGLLAGLVLLSPSSFLMLPMSQYADVPLSFYYLATLVLALLSARSEGSRKAGLAALAGASASLAAWTNLINSSEARIVAQKAH